MKAAAVERHFPWYVDPTDTDNLDCQCGARCDGIAGWATHITQEIPVSFVEDTQKFVEIWSDSLLAQNIGTLLRCEEVEALAGMLRALGATTAGGDWIDAHAPGDECDDMHCVCIECGAVTA